MNTPKFTVTTRYLTRETPGVEVVERGMTKGCYYYLGEHDSEAGVWKLDVGAECNRLLEHALNIEQNSDYSAAYKSAVAADIRSLVKRVAAFEELTVE
jgi:hypothetical protein